MALKAQQPDAILLFRMGDFYETFDEDAERCARELGIALTSRPMGKEEGRIPLAGVPHHQLERALERLVGAGHRVAIAEQVSEPGHGLVERRIVRVVTPGTVESGALVPAAAHNWLAALAPGPAVPGGGPRWALAACDVTTGELELQLLAGDELGGEWARLQPRELLIPDDGDGDADDRDGGAARPALPPGVLLTRRPARRFAVAAATEALCAQLAVATLDGFGIAGLEPALGPAGALLDYLAEAWPGALAHLRPPRPVRAAALVFLDAQTRRNLELFAPARAPSVTADGGATGSGALLDVLDDTRTPMGARLLRLRLGRPLRDRAPLEARLDAVAAFVDHGGARQRLREQLRGLPDVERLLGRVRAGSAHAKHLVQLRRALERLPAAAVTARDAGPATAALVGDGREGARAGDEERTGGSPSRRVEEDAGWPPPRRVEEDAGWPPAGGAIATAAEAAAAVAAALSDDPPADPVDGDTVRPGFDPEVDRLRGLASGARAQLTALEAAERARSGLGVKVGYHRVFGYYLELPRAQAARAPADYEPRQTLAAAQRFRFAPLTALEGEILEAKDALLGAERAVLERVRAQLAAAGPAILRAAAAIAALDVAAALAAVAVDRGYVRPELVAGAALAIEDGRHPIVERELPAGAFVPNDAVLDADAAIVVLTGPNMGGKSTYLRQTALIVLLAQCGSFVPARRARVPLVDRIFSRVGAQDDLAAGQSTFMVEMVETATILHHATERSLVILDEVGRGTATDDGLAIAQAVVEYLHHRPRGAPLTLFATHFHELTALAATLPRVVNRSVAVSEAATETGGDVVFLHRIVDGGADRSYGVHVAALAGLPRAVVARARELLRGRAARPPDGGTPVPLATAGGARASATPLLPPAEPLLAALAAIEPDGVTPLEALQELYELRAAARRRLGHEG